MRRLFFRLSGLVLFSLMELSSYSQVISPQEKSIFTVLHSQFNSNNAYETVGYVEQRWRLAGNAGFNESIFYVEKILQDAGFVREVNSEAEGPLTYRIEKRPMKRPTWDPIDAQLYIVGDDKPLLEFKTNRNMLAMYSAATTPEGVTAELIDVGKGTKTDWE